MKIKSVLKKSEKTVAKATVQKSEAPQLEKVVSGAEIINPVSFRDDRQKVING